MIKLDTMHMYIKIRKLKKEDIKEVSKLVFNLYKKWDKIDPIDKIDKKWFCSDKHYVYLRKLIKNKNNLFLVAQVDNKIAGYLLARVRERAPFLQKVGDISETYIDPKYSRKGIGSSLTKIAFDWVKKNRFNWITVSTHSLDKEAIYFWESKGFKEFNKDFKIRIK